MPLYSLLLLIALVAGAPLWLVRLATRSRYRAGLAERLGRLPAALRTPADPGITTIWLHAVSVGEVLAAATLVERLRALRPTWRFAVSTTTEAGQHLARARFPNEPVFYLPLDFATLQRRILRALHPRLLILMESELWPNLLVEARRAGCRIAVANARISDRSFPRYRRLRRLWAPLLGRVDLFLAQGPETATRLRSLGVAPGRIVVAGNLKYDLKAAAQGSLFARLEAALPAGARVVAAGSTLEGEEAIVLEAWTAVMAECPNALLLLAPRHPARFDAVAALLPGPAQRASLLAAGQILQPGTTLLLDTIGDLAGLYALADVAFLGGSLVPAGGHNPLEPARFGVPVVMGPSTENFREIVAELVRADSITLLSSPASAPDLAAALLHLLRNDEARRTMGERAAAVVETNAGAAARSAQHLLALAEASR